MAGVSGERQQATSGTNDLPPEGTPRYRRHACLAPEAPRSLSRVGECHSLRLNGLSLLVDSGARGARPSLLQGVPARSACLLSAALSSWAAGRSRTPSCCPNQPLLPPAKAAPSPHLHVAQHPEAVSLRHPPPPLTPPSSCTD